MNAKKRKYIIDCERLKYPNTGLYSYCYHLTNAMNSAFDPSIEEISVFLPKHEVGVLGKNLHPIIQHAWHKFFLPSTAHAVWHSTHQESGYFPSSGKTPILLTIHDINIMHLHKKKEEKKKKFLQKLEKRIRQVDHISFISAFTKNDVNKYIDLNEEKCSVIYNGCNINEIEDLITPADSPSRPFLFTLGTITQKKNFHVLPALIAGTDYLLLIAGITQSNEYKSTIMKEAIKHGVEKQVIFLGAVNENDKQWYLKNCEAFLFPSIAEGFGLPVIEAMYFGKPIFLSTFTSLPEIGGELCFYFNSFDKEDMKLTFKNGLDVHRSNPERSNHLTQRAQSFSWKTAAKSYLDIYRKISR